MPRKKPTIVDELRLEDHHGDPLQVGIETEPTPWPDPDDRTGEADDIAHPTIYITGDAYLTVEQAEKVARHLIKLACELDPSKPKAVHR